MPSAHHALVTGASAGIGAEFARQLAARGRHLVLTARRTDRIEALARELSERHGIDARAIPGDLADPATPAALQAAIEAAGIVVDTLINNAGYGVTGSLVARDWKTHSDFIQVMIAAPAELCHRFVPGMRERGYGRIVNVASLAGLMPAPAGHTLYAASKAYLIKFSQSLALENSRYGIRVLALCPGFTRSEFHDANGVRNTVDAMPRWIWLDARKVVREGLDAVERGDIVYINGLHYRAIKALFKLLPDRLALKLIARRAKSFRVVEPPPA